VLKRHLPGVRVIGASPRIDAAMVASVQAGRVVGVDAQPSLSDGTAGSVEEGAITLELCRTLVDDWVLVDEADIRASLRQVIDTEHQLIEGAAATAFAAARIQRAQYVSKTIAVISCGANIAASTLATALAE
jgi:threonine dehydratase